MSYKNILAQINGCTFCEPHLSHKARPVVTAHAHSRIVVIGQAPGRKVHESGIPWDDKSGDRLREWMGLDKEAFYDTKNLAIIPMGFCYPGTGKSGDLPPRRECAPLWHGPLLESLERVQLTLLIGAYAQRYYLRANPHKSLTETVRSFRDFLPDTIVLPHPSPRNNIWMKRNPWFGRELLPVLKEYVRDILP
ncbi:uracil-DNA glycosylase family protein [Roseivirga sp. BDSF3-8]|uniref:uracil-DNA glycosylase family protein n=1 Tax=Roseivirga sp. BDSF3-8 TaxID=3241598 RepID=UPI003531CBBB